MQETHKLNIQTVMLSGDKQSVVDQVAKTIGIDKDWEAVIADVGVALLAILNAVIIQKIKV